MNGSITLYHTTLCQSNPKIQVKDGFFRAFDKFDDAPIRTIEAELKEKGIRLPRDVMFQALTKEPSVDVIRLDEMLRKHLRTTGKSQLTDIYNRAVGGVEAKPPPEGRLFPITTPSFKSSKRETSEPLAGREEPSGLIKSTTLLDKSTQKTLSSNRSNFAREFGIRIKKLDDPILTKLCFH